MTDSTMTACKTALLAGALVGGTLSLLYAPVPGAEMRRLLHEKSEVVRHATHRPTHGSGETPSTDDKYSRKLDALHIERVKEEYMQNRLVTMGFVTGALIGGALGLLYAPKAGKETREFLKTKADYTKEEARILAEHAKQVALDKAHKAKMAAEAAAAAAAAAAKHETEEAQQ